MSQIRDVVSINILSLPWDKYKESRQSRQIKSEIPKSYDSESINEVYTSSDIEAEKNIISMFSVHGDVNSSISYSKRTAKMIGRGAVSTLPIASAINYRNYENKRRLVEINSQKTINNSYTSIRRPDLNAPKYPVKKYDNGFVNHAIPATLYGFKWISDNSNPNYYLGSNNISYPQGRLYDYKNGKGIVVDFLTSSYDDNRPGDYELDIVGTNTSFYEPSSLISLTSGANNLSYSNVSVEDYNKYLSNKKYISYRSRGFSLWTKQQNSIVRSLGNKNLVSATKRNKKNTSTEIFKVSPISVNNVVRIRFEDEEKNNYYVETDLSDTIDNEKLSYKYRTSTAQRERILRKYNNTSVALANSEYKITSFESRETIFPKRTNYGSSFSKARKRYEDSTVEKSKKTTSIRNFWYKKESDRIRPDRSSNALDYKSSTLYNTQNNQVDSIFPLDNSLIEGDIRLVGELSYQGKEFYKNLISRSSLSSLKEVEHTSRSQQFPIETQDSLKIQIITDRNLEKINAKRNLVSGVSLEDNYQWGTSLSPYDLHRNFLYHTGAFFDKSKFKIDLKAQPNFVLYNNRISVLSSYKKTQDVLDSFNISMDRAMDKHEGDVFSIYSDGDIRVSQENPKINELDKDPIPTISDGILKNVPYNSIPRPTMQLFYQPKEFYSQEEGFSFNTSENKIPFYSNWGDFEKGLKTGGAFVSILPEFNMSENFDEYQSSRNKINTMNRAFLSLPGSGETSDSLKTSNSRKVKIKLVKKYSFDGLGITEISAYPTSDNNYAWYSSRNRDGKLQENLDYRGKNIAKIPDDSTFSLANSRNTPYNIIKTDGFEGLNSIKNSWYSIEPKVKKNAAAEFNTEDFMKDYIEFHLDKFGTNENIDSSQDSFTISLWYQPEESWFNAEDTIGLFSLVNDLGRFSQHISVYAKGVSGGVSVNSSFSENLHSTAFKHTTGQLNNLVFSYSAGTIDVYLNSIKVIDSLVFTHNQTMSKINKISLGISGLRDSFHKYRGIIDEFYLFSGNPSVADIEKLYSGGRPSNIIEFWANSEFESSPTFFPVIYNRIGYPFVEDVSEYREMHDMKFMNRYVLGEKVVFSGLMPSTQNQTNRVSVKGIKKLLPYNGLYPYQRVMQIGENFLKTYKSGALLQSDYKQEYSQKIQSLLQPFFAPGVIFNSLRAGIECPWPIYTNKSGLEPTTPYGRVLVYDEEKNSAEEKICDNLVPSWYLDESFDTESFDFLLKHPENLEELRKSKSTIALVKSQPKFVKNLNKAGLVINRTTVNKISIQALRDESFYESLKNTSQKNLKKTKAYQYCVLEFVPEDIEDNSGFSIFVPGREENLNITFRKSSNIESTTERYSISTNSVSYDAQIEINAYNFNTVNIQKSICSLFNMRLVDGEYRALCLDRENESIINPELEVMRSLNLEEIDERLDTSGSGRVRIAIVHVGTKTSPDIRKRSFYKSELSSVSTFSGKSNQTLGILYRDKYNAPERNIDLNKIPYGQYDKEFYNGKEIVISTISGQAISSSGAEKKENQIFLLSGDHYTGGTLELKNDFVWPSFVWSKSIPDDRFKKSLNNFVEQSQNFFLKHGTPLRYVSRKQNITTVPGKTYTMEVYMTKTDKFSTTRTKHDNDGKFYGSPYRFQSAKLYRNEMEITDDLSFAPFAPAYHYGETVAKIIFKADGKTSTIQEILKKSHIEYYNPGMIEEYKKRYSHTGNLGLKSFKDSPSYKGKNNLDSCVEFRKTDSEGNWEIALKIEFPMLNYYDNVPTQKRPRGFLYDYGVLPDSQEGVYFGIRTATNQEPGDEEESLIELCGFYDPQVQEKIRDRQENRVGEFAENKVVKEAVIVIPYSEKAYTKVAEGYAITEEKFILNSEDGDKELNLFKVDKELYDKVLKGEESSRSIELMSNRLRNYILPPEIDFINDENKNPFVCYVLETKTILSKQDLADIWQGRLPSKSKQVEMVSSSGEEIFEHPSGPNEFFSGKTIPEETKFIVFKLKQKSGEYHRDGPVYNWPNDYMSILEKASVDFETTERIS